MTKKVRQFRSRQGRTEKQYEDSMKIIGISFLMVISFLAITALFEIANFLFS